MLPCQNKTNRISIAPTNKWNIIRTSSIIWQHIFYRRKFYEKYFFQFHKFWANNYLNKLLFIAIVVDSNSNCSEKCLAKFKSDMFWVVFAKAFAFHHLHLKIISRNKFRKIFVMWNFLPRESLSNWRNPNDINIINNIAKNYPLASFWYLYC